MTPIELLMSEHRTIEMVLDCLEAMCDEARRTKSLDGVRAAAATDFIRNYADRIHHAKEEKRLFVAMERLGFGPDEGPIAVMLSDHNEGRAHVGQMIASITGAADGDEAALRNFIGNAEAFIDLLRSHIYKEDNILYPMAIDMLSQAEIDALEEEFRKADAETGDSDKYLKIAESLALHYKITKKSEDCRSTEFCGHCGGFQSER